MPHSLLANGGAPPFPPPCSAGIHPVRVTCSHSHAHTHLCCWKRKARNRRGPSRSTVARPSALRAT